MSVYVKPLLPITLMTLCNVLLWIVPMTEILLDFEEQLPRVRKRYNYQLNIRIYVYVCVYAVHRRVILT